MNSQLFSRKTLRSNAINCSSSNILYRQNDYFFKEHMQYFLPSFQPKHDAVLFLSVYICQNMAAVCTI